LHSRSLSHTRADPDKEELSAVRYMNTNRGTAVDQGSVNFYASGPNEKFVGFDE